MCHTFLSARLQPVKQRGNLNLAINLPTTVNFHAHQVSISCILATIQRYNNKPFACMSTATFRRLSTRKPVPQHCIDDLACLHCCKCWEKHKKQYEIRLVNLLAKYEDARKQVQFLTRLNMELKAKLDLLERNARKFRDIETMREDFRVEIEEEIKKKREVEDAITQEKISELQRDRKQLSEQLSKALDKNTKDQQRINQLQTELARVKYENQDRERLIEELKQQNQRLEKKEMQLYDLVVSHEKRIDEKTKVIDELRKSINDIQGRFICEKAKASSFGSQKELLQHTLKSKQSYIASLTKCSEENLKNLQNLQTNNGQLKNLVALLDTQAMAGRLNEQYFRSRLIESQERLIMTEGLAHFNGQKVELMKEDLLRLKMTI